MSFSINPNNINKLGDLEKLYQKQLDILQTAAKNSDTLNRGRVRAQAGIVPPPLVPKSKSEIIKDDVLRKQEVQNIVEKIILDKNEARKAASALDRVQEEDLIKYRTFILDKIQDADIDADDFLQLFKKIILDLKNPSLTSADIAIGALTALSERDQELEDIKERENPITDFKQTSPSLFEVIRNVGPAKVRGNQQAQEEKQNEILEAFKEAGYDLGADLENIDGPLDYTHLENNIRPKESSSIEANNNDDPDHEVSPTSQESFIGGYSEAEW
jgi:hypothetical protein